MKLSLVRLTRIVGSTATGSPTKPRSTWRSIPELGSGSVRVTFSASTRFASLPEMPTARPPRSRSEEHTSELQSLMRISYAVFCLKNKKKEKYNYSTNKITHIDID